MQAQIISSVPACDRSPSRLTLLGVAWDDIPERLSCAYRIVIWPRPDGLYDLSATTGALYPPQVYELASSDGMTKEQILAGQRA